MWRDIYRDDELKPDLLYLLYCLLINDNNNNLTIKIIIIIIIIIIAFLFFFYFYYFVSLRFVTCHIISVYIHMNVCILP